MVMAVGLSQHNVALFHVINHSFFKALLFLGAGAVIHSFADQQDLRRFGGLINFLPFTYTCMLVGSLSLMAVPFLTGFYSKDLILELAYSQYQFSGIYAFILGSLAAMMTAYYSVRLLSLVFLAAPNGPKSSYMNSHESKIAVIIPLFVLSLFSIGFGYIFSDMFVGAGSDFFQNSIFISPNNINLIEAEFALDPMIKLLPLICTILGASVSFYFYNFAPHSLIEITETSLGRKFYTFLNGKYLFDVVYNNYIIGFGLKLGYNISKVLDRGIIEHVGPYGLANTLTQTGKNVGSLDVGLITTYSLYITLALLSILFLVFAPFLIDTSYLSEIRLVIIYLASLVLVLSPKSTRPDTQY